MKFLAAFGLHLLFALTILTSAILTGAIPHPACAAALRENEVTRFVMIVPVYRELYNQNIATLLQALAKQDLRGLPFQQIDVWFAVNNVDSAGSGIRTENQETVEYLRSLASGNMPRIHPRHHILTEIARNGVAQKLSIHVLDQTTPGYPTRNIGVVRDEAARTALQSYQGEDLNRVLLAHMDADSSFETNYIRSVVAAFEIQKLKFALLNMSYIDQIDSEARVYQRKILSDYQIAAYAFRMASDGGMPAGGSPRIVTTAQAFLDIGGVPHETVGEDTELIRRLRERYTSEGLFLDIPVYAKYRARDDGYDAAIYLRDLDKPVVFSDWQLETKTLFQTFELWLRKMPLVHRLYEEALRQNLAEHREGVRQLKRFVAQVVHDRVRGLEVDPAFPGFPPLAANDWFMNLIQSQIRLHGAKTGKILAHLEREFPYYFSDPPPPEILDIAQFRAATQAFLNVPFLKESAEALSARVSYLPLFRARYPATATALEAVLTPFERGAVCSQLFKAI